MAKKQKNDWWILLLLLLLFVVFYWMATRQSAALASGLPIVSGVCEPSGTSFNLPPPICLQVNKFLL